MTNNDITNDKVFSTLIEINLEKNFLEAKKRPKIHDIQEGHENNSSIGVFVVQNAKGVLDFIHDTIVFNEIEKLNLKKYIIDHSEPKKDGALIVSDTKISDNVFFSGVVSKALRNVNMTKIDELMKILLPEDFSHQEGGKKEAGSKTRTALSIPLVCTNSKTYLVKKSAYKDVEEATGKVVKFGNKGLEAEFFFANDYFIPLSEEYFFDEKRVVGIIKTYEYNTISKKIENNGKYVVNAKKLINNEGLEIISYPSNQKMDLLMSRLKTKE